MLFDLITGDPAHEVVKSYWEKIKTDFPDIWQNKRIGIRYRDAVRDRVSLVLPTDTNRVILEGRSKMNPTVVSTDCQAEVNGEQRGFRYLPIGSVPTKSGGQVVWPRTKTIILTDNDGFDITADTHKTVWFLYFCDEIQNNKADRHKATPRMELFRPAEDARQKMEADKIKRFYESTILYEDTKHSLSYSRVKEIMTILGQAPQGFEAYDRKTLFDNVWSNVGVRERFDLINSQSVPVAVASQPIGDRGAEIIKKLRELQTDGRLFTEDGIWRLKGKGSPQKITVSTTSEDPIFDLAEHVAGNEGLYDKIMK